MGWGGAGPAFGGVGGGGGGDGAEYEKEWKIGGGGEYRYYSEAASLEHAVVC